MWGRYTCACHGPQPNRLDWVIIGGESGPGARPMDPAWARDIIELGKAAGFAVFMKQLGTAWARAHGRCRSPKGADPAYWPEHLQARQMPDMAAAIDGAR